MLLERNLETGREVHVEERDGLLIVNKTVPKAILNKYLEHNKAEVNAIPQKQYKSALRKKNMWKVASIPTIVIEQWKKEGIDLFKDEDWPKVRAKLNDPDFKFLRTSPGRV